VLNLAALLTIAAALLIAIRHVNAARDHGTVILGKEENFTRTDAEIATHLLASMRGANGVVCAAVDRTFDSGYWGKLQLFVQPDIQASPDDLETAHWVGKHNLDDAVIAVARPALSSEDACTRRIAVRILGNVETKRLDDQLRGELESPVTAIRVAAILALGYSEQTSAVARLRELAREGDRAIRVAAIWALGRIEDHASTDFIIGMLKNDRDPEVRRAAAWALGQIAE
jgi:HEAT repeat protein